jgi:Zn-finger nucleic acid-binding protein
MFIIRCPGCNTEATISLIESVYEGPYRCWKCRGLFRVRIEDEKLQACEPLSEEEFEKEQQKESFDK